jgi:hypothetical protein
MLRGASPFIGRTHNVSPSVTWVTVPVQLVLIAACADGKTHKDKAQTSCIKKQRKALFVKVMMTRRLKPSG